MWLVKKCKVIQVVCLVFLLEGAGVAQPAFSYVWLSPFYRGGTEALSGWASAFKVTRFTYDGAEIGHQAVGFHSTCSSHRILIRDFVSRHPGLEPIFSFGSDFLLAWALKWFSHLEELPQRAAAPGDSREKEGVCVSSVRVLRLSTQPAGRRLINEAPYWRHLGPFWFKITLHPIKTENPQNCGDPIKPLTQRE